MEFVFSRIYRDHAWGGVSRSGPGSDLQHLETYLAILQACLRRPDVNRVVDIGCGDWAASSAIDWSGVEYLGIEVVPELVQQLTTTYGSRQVAFQCADALEAKEVVSESLRVGSRRIYERCRDARPPLSPCLPRHKQK